MAFKKSKTFYPSRTMKNRLNFPFSLVVYIIPLNILWDFLSIYYQGKGSTLALLRAVTLLAFIGVAFRRIKFDRLFISVIILVAYTGILFVTASDLLISLNISIKIFISLLMLPVGYGLIQSTQSMQFLNEQILKIYLMIIFGFILYNIFDVGGMVYIDIGFDTGGLNDNWNLITYCLLMAPMYFTTNYSQKEKIIFYVSFILLTIMLIVSFKRIAVTGLVFGFLLYIYHYGNYRKATGIFILFSIAMLALSPLYIDKIFMKYDARKERMNYQFILEKEGRALETRYIFDEVLSFKNPTKFFFGGEAFNSIGKYAGGIFGKRNAHVDYNLILISNGIIGLILYLNIYLQIIIKYRKLSNKIENNKHMLICTSVFWSFLLTSLLTSFAGQMYAITFRSIIFLYLGAILGLMNGERHFKLRPNYFPS